MTTARLGIEITVDERGDVKIKDLGRLGQSAGQQIEDGFEGATDAVEDFGSRSTDVLKNVGAAVATYLSFDVIKEGVSLFAGFEDQLLITQAASSATSEEFEQLKQKALELGGEPAQTPVMVAEGMAELARAGQDAAEILESVEATALLAAGSELDFAQAAEFTTDILSQFGKTAGDTQMLVDTLIAGANSASVTVTQMAESYKYAGAISDSMGKSVNNTAAALLVLANSGIKSEQGGTSLRAIWTRLLRKSDELTKSYGIQVEEMRNGQVVTRELADIIDDLADLQLTAKERTELFGQIAGPGMSILLKKGGDAIRKYEADLDNAAGTAKRVSETMQSGLGGSLRTIQSDIQVASLKIGEFFAPAANLIAEYSFIAGRGIDALSGTIKSMAAVWTASFGVVLTGLEQLAKVTDLLSVTDDLAGSIGREAETAFAAANGLAEQANDSFESMFGNAQKSIEAEQKYKASLKANLPIIEADKAAQQDRAQATVAGINEITEAERKAAEERQETVAQMYETLGVGGEEYFRNEAQKLLDQAAKWEEAGADQLATQQFLYEKITALSGQAWEAQEQEAGIYLDGLTASFTSATADITADIETVNSLSIDVPADMQTEPFSAGVSDVDSEIDRLTNTPAILTIDGDNDGALSALSEVQEQAQMTASMLEQAMSGVGGTLAINADEILSGSVDILGGTGVYRAAQRAQKAGDETFSYQSHQYRTSDFYSFAGGGFTGYQPRVGGIDGQGGFLAIMHPQEDVIDRTNGETTNNQSQTTVNNNVTLNVYEKKTNSEIADMIERQKINQSRTMTR